MNPTIDPHLVAELVANAMATFDANVRAEPSEADRAKLRQMRPAVEAAVREQTLAELARGVFDIMHEPDQ